MSESYSQRPPQYGPFYHQANPAGSDSNRAPHQGGGYQARGQQPAGYSNPGRGGQSPWPGYDPAESWPDPYQQETVESDDGYAAAAYGFPVGAVWSDRTDEFSEDYEEVEYWPEFSARGLDTSSPGMALVLSVVGIVIILMLLFGFWSMRGRLSAVTAVVAGQIESQSIVVSNPAGETAVVPLSRTAGIATFFAPSVQFWGEQIIAWAERHNLDPNMVATIMQIESCGDPQAVSGAGARGLFQVMPYHFADGENSLDPDTNALRGMNYFADRLVQTGGDVGRAFAGYNGGHVAAASGWDDWVDETRRYYTWSTGIYAEALENGASSPTLEAWMKAGGASLCAQAEDRLGLR